jgi:hypothetical protein
MHYDAVAGEEIGFGIMERSENSIMNALHPRLVELSRADNALDCPSSDDLRQFGCFRKGGSGSSVVEIKRHAGDAANDDLRWSGV